MQQGSSISLAVVSSMMGSLEQTVEVRLAPSLKSGLLLGTKAPVMMPHGTDFSFLCLPPTVVCGVISASLGQAVVTVRCDWR